MENVRLNNFDWTLHKNDNISTGIIEGEHWEPHITNFMKSYLNEGDIAIDIGACFGWHTLEMARIVGSQGLVYAFEPQINNIELLKKNISQNNIDNVNVYEVALGHKNMRTCLCNAYYDQERNYGDSFVSTNYERGTSDVNFTETIGKAGRFLNINKEVINCTTLDDIKFLEDKRIKFIKIDVQGFERMVFQGGEKTLEKHKPVIVVELEDPCMVLFGYSSAELLEYIRTLGYYIYFLDYSYPCDHVCVPFEQKEEFEEQFKDRIHPHTENNTINNNLNNGVVKKISL